LRSKRIFLKAGMHVKKRHKRLYLLYVLRRVVRAGVSKYYLRNCSKVGSWPRVWGKPRIVNRGTIAFGDRPTVISRNVPVELVAREGAMLAFGDHVIINFGTTISAYKRISVGDRVLLGVYTIIADNDQHSLEPERRHELPKSQPVVIEDDVWVGDRVSILKGVRIGRGAVIGAGSVVTKDVPPHCIAGRDSGNGHPGTQVSGVAALVYRRRTSERPIPGRRRPHCRVVPN
jgi:acetyltransferase-like isoleucine patch superfamily enzyme